MVDTPGVSVVGIESITISAPLVDDFLGLQICHCLLAGF